MSASTHPPTGPVSRLDRREPVSVATFVAAGRHVGTLLAFGVIPVVFAAMVLWLGVYYEIGWGLGFDYGAIWRAGNSILEGSSPYPGPFPEELMAEDQYVYPPLIAVVASPLSLLPLEVAVVVFSTLLFGAVALALWILGVRDWRCFGAALLAGGVLDGIRLGAVSALLALGVAVAWRYRDRRPVVAAAVALVVVGKLFLWPLGLWLLATRRYAAAAAAALGGAVAVLLPWALIGFDGIREYPQVLEVLTDILQWKGYSVVALGLSLGVDSGTAELVSYALGALLLAAAFVLARRGDGDFRAFVATIAAAFALTPMLWSHYFVVLLVPIAIRRPRLTPLWVVPIVFWLGTFQSFGDASEIALVLGAAALVLLVAAVPPASLRRLRPRRSVAAHVAPAAEARS